MKKIMGYKLKNIPVEKLEVPLGAKIFTAMDVNGEPTVFAIINPDEVLTEAITVYRVTTAKPVLDNVLDKAYIGSFSVANYGIVYHFFIGEDPKAKSAQPEASMLLLEQAAQAGPPEHPFQR